MNETNLSKANWKTVSSAQYPLMNLKCRYHVLPPSSDDPIQQHAQTATAAKIVRTLC